MQLEDLFSITAWRSSDGWTVCTQRWAGDQVKQSTRATLKEACAANLASYGLPPPPYGVR
jgi:hypothetical protein